VTRVLDVALATGCCSEAFWNSPVMIALISGFFTSLVTLGGLWINSWSQKKDRAAQTQVLTGKVSEVKQTAEDTKTIVNGERTAMVARIAQLEADKAHLEASLALRRTSDG
jgi:predicted membrane metal-binding protein